MSDSEGDDRPLCKYGINCYQTNPVHQRKFKHPRKKQLSPSSKHTHKKPRLDENVQISHDVSNSETSKIEDVTENISTNVKISNEVSESDSDSNDERKIKSDEVNIPSDIHPVGDKKSFIKTKFLVTMPDDFYFLWDVATKLKPSKPSEAFKDIGLILVGPYDVLDGKFDRTNFPDDKYLLHWRYYYDIPEFQTVLKGDDKTGYHIGYFRDEPNELPIFLANNCGTKNGIINAMGGNIFAAIYFYLEELKKTGDPFKKMHVGKFQALIKKNAEEYKLDLSKKTDKMVVRDKKIVTRSFNKIGLVVPFNKKTELGYRELTMDNRELRNCFDKLQMAKTDEEKEAILSKLQPVFTFASIAADECDFGTGIELGWNIICHGVDTINATAAQFLTTSYRLLNREAFAQIAEVHMKNRKRGCHLSIL